MKKHLISITDKQDATLKALSEESEISLSELVRRAIDLYIESLVNKGDLVRVTFSTQDKSEILEIPKNFYKELHDYIRSHPEGALKISQ